MRMTDKEQADLEAAVAQSRADALAFQDHLNKILAVANSIERIGNNLLELGIKSGSILLSNCSSLHTQVEGLRALDARILRREFERTQQASANILNACLAGVELGRQSKSGE